MSTQGKVPIATQAEIASSLAALIATRGAWEVAGGSLIPACKAALTNGHSATDASQSELFGKAEGGSEHRADVSDRLAPHAACHLASDLVQVALRASEAPETGSGPSKAQNDGSKFKGESEAEGNFLAASLSAMLPVAFAMLVGGESAIRRRQAVSTLLPSLLEASLHIKDQSIESLAGGERLWGCCEELLRGERSEKADGFSVIACFKGHLLPLWGAKGAASGALVDVRERPTFWEAIKSGLVGLSAPSWLSFFNLLKSRNGIRFPSKPRKRGHCWLPQPP